MLNLQMLCELQTLQLTSVSAKAGLKYRDLSFLPPAQPRQIH